MIPCIPVLHRLLTYANVKSLFALAAPVSDGPAKSISEVVKQLCTDQVILNCEVTVGEAENASCNDKRPERYR